MSNKISAAQTETPRKGPHDLIQERHVRAAMMEDKGSDARLLSWMIKDFTKKGDNYATSVTSVQVNYSQEGKEKEVSYIVKCNPCKHIDALDTISTNVFKKEAGFYTKLLPLFNAELKALGMEPLRLANCYYVHLEKGEELIFLHDLRCDGFKMVDRKKGLDKNHVDFVVNEFGRVHAASHLVQVKMSRPLEESYDFLLKDFSALSDGKLDFGKMFVRNVMNVAEMTEKVSGYQKVTEWLRDFAPRAPDVFEEQIKKSPPFDVVCFGDTRITNMLFRYDEAGIPIDVRLLDIQLCRKASPATDLAYHFYTSLTGDVRKQSLDSLLKLYHDTFRKVLVTAGSSVPFSLEELHQEYKRKSYFGLLVALAVIPKVVSEASEVRGLQDLNLDDPEEMAKARRSHMLKQLDSNPLLRPRLLSIFDDLVDFGIIS